MQYNKKEVKKAATTASKAKANDLPLNVRPYDILCGRSKACFNNIGNRRFRITIGMNVKKYDLLSNRTERGKFIVELTRTLREEVGYRFFRLCKKTGKVELSDDEIRAKIGHALRDLSITQANVAAEAANKSISSGEEEAKKFSEPPDEDAKVVTPHPPVRRVTNDFETDSKGKIVAMPQCPDLHMGEIIGTSEASQEIPRSIYFSPHQDLLHGSEVAPQYPKVLSTNSMVTPEAFGTPITIEDSSSEGSVRMDKEIDSNDYYMPLKFDEPHDTDMLEPIPLDMLPEYYANAYMIPRSTDITRSPFNMDHGDLRIENSHNSEEMCSKIRRMQGFPSFHSRKHDIMSVGSADDHMTSSGDSVDCLSLHMPIHA